MTRNEKNEKRPHPWSPKRPLKPPSFYLRFCVFFVKNEISDFVFNFDQKSEHGPLRRVKTSSNMRFLLAASLAQRFFFHFFLFLKKREKLVLKLLKNFSFFLKSLPLLHFYAWAFHYRHAIFTCFEKKQKKKQNLKFYFLHKKKTSAKMKIFAMGAKSTPSTFSR